MIGVVLRCVTTWA